MVPQHGNELNSDPCCLAYDNCLHFHFHTFTPISSPSFAFHVQYYYVNGKIKIYYTYFEALH